MAHTRDIVSRPCRGCNALVNLVHNEVTKGEKMGIRCLYCRKVLCYKCAHVHFEDSPVPIA